MTAETLEMSKTICVVCNAEKDVTDFYYCLCDSAICSACIDSVKVDENQWKCPKCGEIMDLESTRLFREH